MLPARRDDKGLLGIRGRRGTESQKRGIEGGCYPGLSTRKMGRVEVRMRRMSGERGRLGVSVRLGYGGGEVGEHVPGKGRSAGRVHGGRAIQWSSM